MSPVFHGYWRAIAEALTARGHQVTTHAYDDNATLRRRAWHQARHELPSRAGIGQRRGLARQHTLGAIRALESADPEVVVVVKGDTLGASFWERLGRLPRVLWLYDEVRRTSYTTDRLRSVGPIATYSPLDDAAFRAAGIDSRLLPLAFDHRLVPRLPTARQDRVVFIGARYPERERVLTLIADADVPVRAYGRQWSAHPLDRLRTWDLQRPPVPSGRDLSRADAYREMAMAAATLNIHGDQDGFTMRTYEACGVGAVQLIDRADVEALYTPGEELLTWSSDGELLEHCRRLASDPHWGDDLRGQARQRTLAEHTFDHRVAVLEATWDAP